MNKKIIFSSLLGLTIGTSAAIVQVMSETTNGVVQVPTLLESRIQKGESAYTVATNAVAKGDPVSTLTNDAGYLTSESDTLDAVSDRGHTTDKTLITGGLTTTGKVTAAQIQLSGGTNTQGTLSWNTAEETVDLIQNGAILQLGQEIQMHIRNDTGNTITNGTVCMFAGTHGASGLILVAPANTSDAKLIVGLATYDIPTASEGNVTTFGKVRGLNTSMWEANDILYVSSGGTLTNAMPIAGLRMPIAAVINKHQNNGTLMVRVTPINERLIDNAIQMGDSNTNLVNTAGYLTSAGSIAHATNADIAVTATNWTGSSALGSAATKNTGTTNGCIPIISAIGLEAAGPGGLVRVGSSYTIETITPSITNLTGYGSAALANAGDFASYEQGRLADTALQPNTDIMVAGVTTTGSVSAASVGGEGIWRFITLTNGVALEVYKPSTTNWVRQAEWTEN